MARAKRTDRAEARRRYRAQLLSETENAELEQPDEKPARAGRPAVTHAQTVRMTGPKGIPPLELSTKPGMFGNLRGAYLPVNIRQDLELIRPIAIRTPALIVPLALVLLAGVFFATDTGLNNVIVVYFVGFMLGPSAMGGPFLAGLLTPRAAWLVGLIVSIVAAVVTIVTYRGGMSGENLALFSLLSAMTGALVGAFAGWYKRFLKLSTPARPGTSQRGRNRPAPKPRPAAGKR